MAVIHSTVAEKGMDKEKVKELSELMKSIIEDFVLDVSPDINEIHQKIFNVAEKA